MDLQQLPDATVGHRDDAHRLDEGRHRGAEATEGLGHADGGQAALGQQLRLAPRQLAVLRRVGGDLGDFSGDLPGHGNGLGLAAQRALRRLFLQGLGDGVALSRTHGSTS